MIALATSTHFLNALSVSLKQDGIVACGILRSDGRNHWISGTTVPILQYRRKIPVNCQCNSDRRKLRRQLKRNVRTDPEAWWIKKAEEMQAQTIPQRSNFTHLRYWFPKTNHQ